VAVFTFAHQHDVLEYRGGLVVGDLLDPEQFGVIARLPALDVLHGQLVGVTASPLTGLTRGLASMLSGLAVAMGEIAEKGLVGGGEEPAAEEEKATDEPAAEAETSEENEESEEAPEESDAESEGSEGSDSEEETSGSN